MLNREITIQAIGYYLILNGYYSGWNILLIEHLEKFSYHCPDETLDEYLRLLKSEWVQANISLLTS